jgi:signal transduction histidine kinase
MEPQNSPLQDLEAKNKFHSDLISMSAHQLRTALAANKWVFKMFLDNELGILNDEQHLFIDKVNQNNERMLGVVNEMIEISKGGDVSYSFGEYNVKKLIESVIFDFGAESKNREVFVEFKSDIQDSSADIECDKDRIRVVLQGLIENAIKYSHKGSSVLVLLSKIESRINISITDQGIGIPLEDQPHIFGKFYRASNAKIKETIGTGLGLFGAKRIIEDHHGKLWFESKPDIGTTFFIELPISRS